MLILMFVFVYNCNVCLVFPATHSLQYVYSGSSGIPNLPEFMTVGLVDGEPFTYYDSNIRREVPRQEWMAKAVYAAYWDQQTQISMNTEPVFKNNIEIAKMRFNQTGGIHTVQWMYGCEWDDEIGVTGAVHQYGYDGSDFIALDFRTMTYVAPVMQAIPTKQKWDSNRAELENIKSYFTQECIDWLKKYVSYGKCTLERTVRPEVSLLQKDPSSPVTCHATGFFPKGIVVTWFNMGKTADLTTGQKSIIDTLHRMGKPQKFIAKEAGCSQSAVSKHINGKSSGRTKCGRRRCTSRKDDRGLQRIIKQRRFKNLADGLEMGYNCRVPQVKPLLNLSQCRKHLNWAKEKKDWTVGQWSKVLFSNESKVCLSFGNQGPRVWRKTGEEQNPSCLRSSVKYPQSVMI
uniref:Ig-like domain-containing protein n=1 Tax=Paramormyrops kingsleyae TaxID=1676925 RepID=A0A3B3S1S0_9TELE